MSLRRNDPLAVISRHASDVVTVADAARHVTYVSPSVERLLGYTPEQYSELGASDIVHSDDLEAVALSSAEVRAYPGAEARCEIRLRHADGSWRWVDVVAINLFHDPEVAGILSIVRDVTDRREAEEARRAGEARFRALVQQSSDAVVVVAADGTITYASEAVERVMGYRAEEAIGQRWTEFPHPDDADFTAAMFERAQRSPGEPVTGEARARHADGNYRWLEFVCTNLLDDPDVGGVVANFRDITGRKWAEAELRGSEERFRALVLSSSDILAVSDADRAVIYVSPSATDVLGWTPDELAQQLGELVHPEDREMAEHLLELAREHPGRHKVGEARYRHADGSWRWMEVTAVNRLDDPDVRAVVTNLRDITARRVAEEALRASEVRFRSLVQHSSDAIGLLDADMRYVWVSESARTVLGYAPEQLVGELAGSFAHPDDVASLDAVTEVLLAQPGEPVEIHGRARHADGTFRWIDVVATNHLADPNVGGIVVNFRDVTSRREADSAVRASEERFRALVQNAADAVVVVDGAGVITYASPGLTAVNGFAPEDALGHVVFGTRDDDRPELREVFAQCIADPGVGYPCVTRVRHKEGGWRWIEMVLQSRLDDPSVEGVVINVRDVTEKRVAEEALRTSEERFRALVQNSSDVMAILDAHARVQWVSPSVRLLLDLEPHQLVGQDGFALMHPDDQDEAAQHLLMLLGGTPIDAALIVRLRHGDGSWIWVDIAASNMLGNPAVDGVVVNLRDVTSQMTASEALRASEERYRTLVQNASDVVQIMDRDGTTTYVSPAVEAILGYEPDDLLGRAGVELCHPDDVDETVRVVTDMLEQRSRSARHETRVRHKSGEWRWVDALISNHLDDPGVRGIVANYRDVTERKTAEQAMRESEQRFRSVAASSPIGIYHQSPEGDLLFVNERWQEITGSTGEPAWLSIVHPEDLERLTASWRGTGYDGRPFSATLRVIRPDGEVRWAAASSVPVIDDHGAVTGHVGTLDDITDRLSAQRDTKRLTDIIEASSDLVAITDKRGRLLYMNGACRRFFGLSEEDDLAEFDFTPFTPMWAQHRYIHEGTPALRTQGIWSGELAYFRRGVEVPVSALFLAHRDEEGHVEFISSVTRDISERKAFEARLEHQATHDPLTGLPNRTLLLDRLEMAVARAARHEQRVAVLFLDLDHFKVVNDSLGHGLGDRLLIALAERLKEALRPGDTVARFGGDEFVILCEELTDEASATAIAARVEESVNAPFIIDDAEVFVTVSVGIAFANPTRAEPEALIRDADAAMYQAKERGRARVAVFDERMRAGVVDRLELENALRRALERHELRVYYQPKIELVSGRIVGFEALLRWEHPERGLLLPYEFITLAEETGLIVPIGAWVLDQACRQLQRVHAERPGQPPMFACVNLSGRQLEHATFIEDVAAVLSSASVDPSCVVLEITENVVMKDALAMQATLASLKALGVKLAVDDFGTGYSSLAYLRRFPVDLLKVDRAFVDGLGRDPEDSAIVAAVVTLAHTLGMQAIAEGVETADQLEELRALGCDMAQGYLIARPLPAADMHDILASDPRW